MIQLIKTKWVKPQVSRGHSIALSSFCLNQVFWVWSHVGVSYFCWWSAGQCVIRFLCLNNGLHPKRRDCVKGNSTVLEKIHDHYQHLFIFYLNDATLTKIKLTSLQCLFAAAVWSFTEAKSSLRQTANITTAWHSVWEAASWNPLLTIS